MPLNIYFIDRPDSADWDEYRNAVVIAESEDDARTIHPNGSVCEEKPTRWDSWIPRNRVIVTQIGVALESQTRGSICANCNQG